MDTENLNILKEKLERELSTLELELTDIGKINTADHYDWTGTSGSLETGTADANVLADKIEEERTNDSVVRELEARRASVLSAIEKIKSGDYGVCEKCGKEISKERLDANPAASTCIEHAN